MSTIRTTIENLTGVIVPTCDQLIHTQMIEHLLPLKKYVLRAMQECTLHEWGMTGPSTRMCDLE